ncbi:MAG: heparan-alpha-glucosaminide N-acetyltransferase domain-containing protein [Eubacteriales bacterium]|nr:heparan-alpha-glucosaminide N-acetyltransferase domain-containing protein [Eubacteriales bacterium]
MRRYEKLDTFRGMMVLSMVLYHGVWDVVYLFGKDVSWYGGWQGRLWQQSICWSFIFLSGFCCTFGKSKWKNGVRLMLSGGAVTLVTLLVMPQYPVIFGILTFLGMASCLVKVLEPWLRRWASLPASIGSFLLFLVLGRINEGYVGWRFLGSFALPKGLYRDWITALIGFPFPGFASSDYFSLFPWIFLYAAGFFSCCWMKEKKERMYRLERGSLPWISWMGRHSLLLYMLHQPLLYGCLSIVFVLLS